MTDTAYLLPSAISHDHTRTTDYHSNEEELVSDGYSSEEDDEMGELSDSPSSHVSSSRPTTPSVNYGRNDVNRRAKSASPPISSSLNDRFTLAHKAEKILGLVPGTLPHARACLENARDEAKRLASESVMGPGSFGVSFYEPLPQGYSFAPSMDSDGSDSGATANGGQNGMRSRFDRAKRAMSVTLTSVQGRTPGVFVGVGGKDEEERRERRRRATDGVIYWQKQIAMLEEEEARVLRAQQQDQPRSLHHSKTVRKRR